MSYHRVKLHVISSGFVFYLGGGGVMARFFVRRGVGRGALVVLGLMVAACGDDGTGPEDTEEVAVQDNQFSPEDIVVSPGATVTWTWSGINTHNVNFAAAGITDSPDQATGTHSTTMPTTPGTYAYQCDFHPALMTGSVQVQ
jgi:plastocyanin